MIDYSVGPARPQQAIDAEPFHQYVFDDGTVWTEFYRSGEDYVLRFPELADFDVSADGTRVVAHPAPESDAVTVEHLYINQLVPLALSRQGRPAFHASVVAIDGGAIAFLGTTGMGKSTLAASFSLEGIAFLTDDALIIEERESPARRAPTGCVELECYALPSHASVRLWEDSVEALQSSRPVAALGVQGGLPQQAASYNRGQAPSYTDKARLLAGDEFVFRDKPARLLAAYLLQDDGANNTTIAPLEGSARHMAWVENSFLLDIEDRDMLARHFDWTHRISSRVPTFSLDYPRDYGMLPDVRRSIQKHAAALT